MLKSSKKILVKNGKINEDVLIKMIAEAYEIKGLYAENEIIYKRIEGGPVLKECKVSYKELWDCYRNLTGEKDKHPYDKEFSDKEKADVFSFQYLDDLGMDILDYYKYLFSNLSPPTRERERQIRVFKSLIKIALKKEYLKIEERELLERLLQE